MGGFRCSLGNSEWNLGHDGGPEQGIWDQRRAPLVEDFNHCFRADDLAGNYGSDGAGSDAFRQPGRDDNQSSSWLACSHCCLARHAMVGDSNTASRLIRLALSLRTKLKRSTVAMEYPRSGCGNFVVGGFDTAPSDLSAT